MKGAAHAAILAVLTPAIVAAQNQPLDYTQWRGLNRDGSASAFVEPKRWPDTLTRKWRVDVGEGYATPLIVGDSVYVFTRRDGNEGITALDASSGGVRWRTDYPASFTPTKAAEAHGIGPKATPLFIDGKLFTLGINGIVAAFDAATGKLLWRTDAPAEHPFFSAASSAVSSDGLVLAHPGNYGPLTAFDPTTGTVKWTAGAGAFFASPLVTTIGGIRQVVTISQKGVIGVSLPAGEVLWTYEFPVGGGGPMPVVNGDTIVVSAFNSGVAAFQPVRRDGKWTVVPLWRTDAVSMYLCNPVVIRDALFGLSQRASGQFFALDARTGATLWLGPPREATNTAVVKAGDLLFLLNDDADLIVARASRTAFTPLKRYTVADSATWAQPAVSGNRIFIKDVGSLTLWTVD